MNTKVLIGSIVVVIVVVIGFIIVSRTPTVADTGKIKVMTSFYPLYFFASEIGGDMAEVTNITPAGAEPHDYEPTSQDMVAIQDSDLFVFNGVGLEAWASRIIKDAAMQAVIVEAADGLAHLEGDEHEHEEDGHIEAVQGAGDHVMDPHVWLSPILAVQMVDKIAAGFIQADPANAAYYEANTQVLKSQLADLDAAYRSGLAVCTKKDFVTSHAAFGYIAAAYGLNQVSIAGLSPDAEPSVQKLAEIARFAKQSDVKYIFFEELVSPKLSQTVATEIGAETLVLNPIEGLTAKDIAVGKNYLTEMRDNLANLRIALECK